MAAVLLILSLLYTQIGAYSKDVSMSSETTASSSKSTQSTTQNQEKVYADRPRHGHGHGYGREQRGDVYAEESAPQYSSPTTDDIATPDNGNSLTQPEQRSSSNNSDSLTQTDQSSSSDSGDSLSQSEQGSDTSSSISTVGSGDKPSLNDYLSSLFCNGCGKHCSLLSLRCDRGIPQLEAAKQQYQAIYAEQQ
jgi:hypothetical protein